MLHRLILSLIALATVLAAEPAFAQDPSFDAAYVPSTMRMVGVKFQFPGGTTATPIVTDPNNGGTIRQQHCTGPTAVASGAWTLGYIAAYQDGLGEHPLPNTITYAGVHIEYPPGTLMAVTFGGLSSVTITPGTESSPAGTEVRTDPINVAIPADTCFYETAYVTVPSGGDLPEAQRYSQTGNGEGFVSGSNLTGSAGALAGAVNIYMMGATDMLAVSNKPAVCIVPADSIAVGSGDTATISGPVDDLVGYPERGLSNNVAWQNEGRSSNRLQFWLNANAFQSITAGPTTGNCTSAFIEAQTNDLYTYDLTLAQLETSFLTVANDWDAGGVHVFAATMLPRVACSPDCTTLANQTPYTPEETVREAYNTWLLAGVTLNSGRTVTVWDIASLAHDQSGPDITRWREDLGTPSTDGIHPTVNLTPTLASGVGWWQVVENTGDLRAALLAANDGWLVAQPRSSPRG